MESEALQIPALRGKSEAGLKSWPRFPPCVPLLLSVSRLYVWIQLPRQPNYPLAPSNVSLATGGTPRSAGGKPPARSGCGFLLLFILFITSSPSLLPTPFIAF